MSDGIQPRPTTIDELLTIVPYQIGFTPEWCLLVVPFGVDDAMQGLFSTNPPGTEMQAEAIWDTIVPLLPDHETVEVAIVCYGPFQAVSPVLHTAEMSPLPVRHMIRVQGEHYWDLSAGPALNDIAIPWTPSDALAAAFVMGGRSVAPSIRDLSERLTPGTDSRTPIVAALLDRDSPERVRPGMREYRALEDEYHARADRPRAMDIGAAVRILTALRDNDFRAACCGWHDAPALWLWDDLLHMTPESEAAHVLGLSALAHYFDGSVIMADMAAMQALELDPHQVEAHLTSDMISEHLMPHESAYLAKAVAMRAVQLLAARTTARHDLG